MTILVSACLMGVCCRYDGKCGEMPQLRLLLEKHTLIPVCPELLGGLPTPREPCEIQNDRVLGQSGTDRTSAYQRGADEALKLARLYKCECALLKERSPSCGYGFIYDGTFSGTLTKGSGVCAALFAHNGIRVLGESRAEELL